MACSSDTVLHNCLTHTYLDALRKSALTYYQCSTPIRHNLSVLLLTLTKIILAGYWWLAQVLASACSVTAGALPRILTWHLWDDDEGKLPLPLGRYSCNKSSLVSPIPHVGPCVPLFYEFDPSNPPLRVYASAIRTQHE